MQLFISANSAAFALVDQRNIFTIKIITTYLIYFTLVSSAVKFVLTGLDSQVEIDEVNGLHFNSFEFCTKIIISIVLYINRYI